MAKIKFLGGAREVGRSGFLLDVGDKILMDYGVKLSTAATEYPLPVDTNLNASITSHAHLDHSGNLPHLFQTANAMAYMTPPTLDLAKMLWFDTLKIAGLEGMDAQFSRDEIAATEKHTFKVGYNQRMDISENTEMQFYNAGHILGSAITKIWHREGTFVYTGDFKAEETRLHNGADLKLGGCDTLMLESTYGDRNHPPRKETEKLFVEHVQDTIDAGGHALIAAFAVGRSQEVIDILHEYNINADIYLDGMCQKASRIYLDFPKYLKNPQFLKKALNSAKWVKSMGMRKKALSKPSVIVCTSGMLQGGPVHAYLPEIYKDKNSRLMLTGYQVTGTPGRTLLETGKINLDGINVEPKMHVEKYDFSAHASHDELIREIERLNPEKVICVHGDTEVIDKFAREIKEKGFEVFAPSVGDEIEI
ncbi:MAG: MBL fold metallo-hydrolase [Candidatus Diapherotrites archaeon]|nr:MBL fold metallo-hydrolase [Candidatus Micrarchaeota archaeon]MBU1939706.1 MBL fold metallo-hydrolase [Candidatus Micrarchaeota archaeon]